MDNKITYKYTNKFDKGEPGCGFDSETDYIITDGVYDFECYLQDNEVRYEIDEDDSDLYFVTDQDGNRTGEAFMIIGEESTDEDLMG